MRVEAVRFLFKDSMVVEVSQ